MKSKPNKNKTAQASSLKRMVGRRGPTLKMNEYQKMMQEMVRHTREDNADIIAEMPNKATTRGQRALKRKHGTPRSFARACVNAIGEISCLEAHTAIRKYLREWNAA